MNLRKVMYIVIALVCVWSIAVGVKYQVDLKTKPELSKKTNTTTEVPKDTRKQEPTKISQEVLKSEFDKMFTNKLATGQADISGIEKRDKEKDLVYTYQAQQKKELYELDINFPVLNINSEIAEKITNQSREDFINKGNDIIQNATEQTVYSITYVAYVNNDILSIIIKSNLKEGDKAQQIKCKAYNINLSTGKEVSLNELISVRGTSQEDVEKEIKSVVSDAIKEASSIQETGYDVYTRDANSTIYQIEKIETFYLDKDGALCIVFAYGNNDYTSEMDIVKI